MVFQEKLKKIKLLILDVDGVMTSGQLFYGESGEILIAFNILDGLGIEIAIRQGLNVIILTRRTGQSIIYRSNKLGIKEVYKGIEDKKIILEEIKNKHNLSYEEISYMGDDLIDLSCMRKVGLAVAVNNAVQELKEISHYVTHKKGGEGAVREIIELILKAQNKWEQEVQKYQ
ncbi:MAG: HAD hydrolase family protein [bacterium]